MSSTLEQTPLEPIRIWNSQGKVVGEFSFRHDAFNGRVNPNVIHQGIRHQLAAARQGTASTKTRSEIRGSTRKPWRQKGTGRARAGSANSPLWRGGGVVFGPHPRDYGMKIPKKVLRQAFVSVLNSQLKSNRLLALEDFEMERHSTKMMASILEKLVPEGRLLLVLNPDDGGYATLRRSSRNLKRVRLANENALELKDLYYAPTVVVVLSALKKIDERMVRLATGADKEQGATT